MDGIEKRTMDKVAWRLVPFLMLCYFIAYLDRVNVGFAGGPMSKDLGLSAAAFGGAAGIFFFAYFLFEVPSNLALNRFGARKWIARIMFTWGLISGAQAFVTGELSFNIVRLLLGVAEAGFFPGIIFFLTLWFPSLYRARIVGLFMFAIPISTVIGAPISGFILDLEGVAGLHGWQWMFIIEAIPALLMTGGRVVLPDRSAGRRALARSPRSGNGCRPGSRPSGATANRSCICRCCARCCDPRIIALGFVYMGCNIPQYGLSFFLPQIVKAFGGLTNFQTGAITALPYVVGAIGMILWSRHSDQTGERKFHAVIPLATIVIGLAPCRGHRRPGGQDAVPLHRRLRLLRGAAGVLDAAHRLPQRHRRCGRHRRGQLDRQSRRVLRAQGLRRAARQHRQRPRRARLPRRLRPRRDRHRPGAGPQPVARARRPASRGVNRAGAAALDVRTNPASTAQRPSRVFRAGHLMRECHASGGAPPAGGRSSRMKTTRSMSIVTPSRASGKAMRS